MRRAIGSCALVFSFSLGVFGAAPSPVADAAMKGDLAGVKSLIQQKADVNAPQADGATAIQWAVYRNNVVMADTLIAAGANVKLANRDGATALRLASLNGNAPMIERLDCKATPDAPTRMAGAAGSTGEPSVWTAQPGTSVVWVSLRVAS